jgi:hypothetical protein
MLRGCCKLSLLYVQFCKYISFTDLNNGTAKFPTGIVESWLERIVSRLEPRMFLIHRYEVLTQSLLPGTSGDQNSPPFGCIGPGLEKLRPLNMLICEYELALNP